MSGDGIFSRAWEEAKRRRLPGILLGYPAGSWLAIEAIPVILGNLGANSATKEQVASGITILAIAAFPLVLLLTWMFQVVPHADAPDRTDGPHRWRRLFLASSVILVTAGCVTLAGFLWPPVSAAHEAPPWWASRSVDEAALAVLPPEVLLGDERTRNIADCLVRRLADRLVGVAGLVVRGPAETAWLASAGLSPDSLAAGLGVGTLIRSTAELLEGELRLTFRVVDASGRQTESVSVAGEVPALDETYETLAGTLEVKVREALGRSRGALRTALTSGNPDAQDLADQADQELEMYHRHLDAGDLDAALASLARADRLLGQAAEEDQGWAEPVVRRAWLWHERGVLLLTTDRAASVAAHRESLAHADAAVARDGGHAEALRLRGLAAIELAATGSSPKARRLELLERADADLRKSQSRHRNRAEVRYLLAQVKAEQGQLSEALAIARGAYEHDAYFSLSNRVLSQLFDLSFQLSRDAEATAWCEEGRRRFPEEWVFAVCRLTLMGWGPLPPDVRAAHALVEEALAAYPRPFRGALRPHLETLAAAVHVRAGDAAGAREILSLTALAAPPAVHVTAAGVWLLLGERDEALAQLRRYLARAPGEAHHLPGARILGPLSGDPGFLILTAGVTSG
jgi:tetratricopeptide (TPR) repeat protein/TolB-like protein